MIKISGEQCLEEVHWRGGWMLLYLRSRDGVDRLGAYRGGHEQHALISSRSGGRIA